MTPQTDATYTVRIRPGWDIRAWSIGLTGSTLASLGLIFGGGTGIGKSLAASAPGFAQGLVVVGALLIVLVLPGILTGIARRRWLVWSYLPMTVMFLWVFAAALIGALQDKSPGGSTAWTRTDTIAVIAVVLSPLAVSIPVALGRLWMYSNRARRAARLAFEQAQFTMDRAGVWPPPPQVNLSDADAPGKSSYR